MSNEAPRDVGVRSVERAIAILDLLAQGEWRTGAEVARGLHVHRSTALRLLATLERHALVERDQRTARYRLGRRLPQLASVVSGEFDLRYVARPVCEQVAGAAGEVVAALDVSGPSHRLGRPDLDRLTIEGAADLSRRLGFRGRRSET